jgi:hypothetical protein
MEAFRSIEPNIANRPGTGRTSGANAGPGRIYRRRGHRHSYPPFPEEAEEMVFEVDHPTFGSIGYLSTSGSSFCPKPRNRLLG